MLKLVLACEEIHHFASRNAFEEVCSNESLKYIAAVMPYSDMVFSL